MPQSLPQTLIEKIAQAHAEGLAPGHVVQSGDFLTVRPAHVMTHDNTGAVIPKFRSIGAERVADPHQPVFALDHDVQNTSEANLDKYARIEAFAGEMGVAFHPAGRGIGHQIMCEEGFVLPGTMVVASDSHSNIYGGLGALGTPVVRTDAAALWATGTAWYQVPRTTRVTLEGALPRGVTGKDANLLLCGTFNQDEVLNQALEFTGPGVASLSIDERLSIANMTTEWGTLAGVFPCDDTTIAWLEERLARLEARSDVGYGNRGDLTRARLDAIKAAPPAADEGAHYAQTITLDLSRVTPAVSGPHHLKTVAPVSAFEANPLPIQKAYLLSCVNGRADDLSAAAGVLRGKRVAEGVELYVAAASSEVEHEVRERGDWALLEAAGARFLPPGCGPCIGLGTGLLGPNEVAISATNRNFKGRMGDRSARCYLASPATVAASAIAGQIKGSVWEVDQAHSSREAGGTAEEMSQAASLETHTAPEAPAQAVAIREGFPAEISGGLLLLDEDNLNTDGIYGKDVTYQDNLSPEEMAGHAFANYDPAFQQTARTGDLIVAGFNFGCGSSREQAATCLKYFGIPLVIAGSFSETYKRNAFNNGYLCIECPQLVEALRAEHSGSNPPSLRLEGEVTVDFAASRIRFDSAEYAIGPVGAAAQDLIIAGGLEAQVRAVL